MTLLTTREAADRLGRSQDFVRHLIRNGRLDVQRINNRWYVLSGSVDRLLTPLPQVTEPRFPRVVQVKTRRGRQ